MLRNNSKLPLIPNGPRRPGQCDWHDENCQIEDGGISKTNPPHRIIWCATHRQWAHEKPISCVYAFKDGTEVKMGG
jgi:hypothetical protein